MADLKDIINSMVPSKEESRRISIKIHSEAKKNKTCLSYWYPRIKEGIPEILMPETELVFCNAGDKWHLFDGKKTPHIEDVVRRLTIAANKMGYPCFMKDGIFSGKHDWDNTCFIQGPDQIFKHLYNIAEMAETYGVMDVSLYFCIRKFIPTAPAFFAFNGMPVTCERRYFVKEGKVVFHHPYWIPDSIQNPTSDDWAELLEELNKETKEEVLYLKVLTEKIGILLGGAWSVDWLKDREGNWWLTDMAEAHKSFIWKDYPYGKMFLGND